MDFHGVDIQERSRWKARPPTKPWRPLHSSAVRLIVFHHTVSYANVVLSAEAEAKAQREMQNYHISKGWGDIGQHFTVFASGRIFEGRPIGTVGVHAAGANSYTVGIEHQGNFELHEVPEAQIKASAMLCAAIYKHFGWKPDRGQRIRPHREFYQPGARGSTVCPGRYGMIALEKVRSLVDDYIESRKEGREDMARREFYLTEMNESYHAHVFLGRPTWLHLIHLGDRAKVHVALYRWGTEPFKPENAAWRGWIDVENTITLGLHNMAEPGEYLLDVHSPDAEIYGDVED